MQIGPYTLIKELGCGGMAQVWLGRRTWDNGKKMTCVIKMPRKKAALDPDVLRQFDEESKLSMKLEHDNIVRVFDTGVFEGLPYMVMNYVAGANLLELIRWMAKIGHVWDPNTAIHIAREIGHALAYVHEMTINELPQRVIHRDIASKNILVNATGGVLLADFGVATSISTNTTRNHVKGTLAYMAPEHYLGQACPASDAFGLGAILWELLTGQLFRAEIPAQELTAAVVEGYVPEIPRGDVPEGVRHIVSRLLHPSADQRMSTIELIGEVEGMPNRRMDLRRTVMHFLGKSTQPSGFSQVHFAASPELVETLAAVRVAGVAMSELSDPPNVTRAAQIPDDFEPTPTPHTTDFEPPPRDEAAPWNEAAVAIPVEIDRQPTPLPPIVTPAGPAGSLPPGPALPATLRLPDASPGINPDNVAPTEVVPIPFAVAETSGPAPVTRPAYHPPAPSYGGESQHYRSTTSPAHPWGPSPERGPTAPLPSTRSERIAVRLMMTLIVTLGVAAGVGGIVLTLTKLSPQGSTLREARADDRRVAGPDPTSPDGPSGAVQSNTSPYTIPPIPAAMPSRGERSLERRVSVASTWSAVSDDARPRPMGPQGAEPDDRTAPVDAVPSAVGAKPSAIETPVDDSATQQTTPARRAPAKRPMVPLVVRRGFVDYAELRVHGRVYVIPARGSVELNVPAGRRRVQWRTRPEAPWHTMVVRFEPNVQHTCLLGLDGPRFANVSQGNR